MFYSIDTMCELCGGKIHIHTTTAHDLSDKINDMQTEITPLKCSLQICGACNKEIKDDNDMWSRMHDILTINKTTTVSQLHEYLSAQLNVSLSNDITLKNTLERVL